MNSLASNFRYGRIRHVQDKAWSQCRSRHCKFNTSINPSNHPDLCTYFSWNLAKTVNWEDQDIRLFLSLAHQVLPVQTNLYDTKVVFYWNQPFQPQPVWVDKVDVSQENTFPTVLSWNAVTPGNSPYASYITRHNHANAILACVASASNACYAG